jgi:transposase
MTPEQRHEIILRFHQGQSIRRLLERYPQITTKRILEEIRADGYTGSYSNLSAYVSQIRARKSKPFTERFETPPGMQAQVDYSEYTIEFTAEGRRRVYLFSYILGYSR